MPHLPTRKPPYNRLLSKKTERLLQVRTVRPPNSRLSRGFLLTGTRDGGVSSNTNQNPSPTYISQSNPSSPIYINVQVNNKHHLAILDTGSAVTIINQQLLKRISHKKFEYNRKSHQSANNTSIKVIGEIELEIKIHGHTTFISADVATNLVADLLLGNDWINANNVIIDSPQQKIFLTDRNRHILATTNFARPPDLRLPALLTNEITLPPYSEKCIDVTVTSEAKIATDALFEPTPSLQSKQVLLANALIRVNNNRTQITVINANDRQRTLSKNTRLGHVTVPYENQNYFSLPVSSIDQSQQLELVNNQRNVIPRIRSCTKSSRFKRKVQKENFTCGTDERIEQNYECYVCNDRFLSRNDLQQHLRKICYPQDIRDQIEKLTSHINDPNQKQQLKNILWKHGKLFDLRKPSIIEATVRHAIETGAHPPIYTSPYRVSYKDEQVQRE